MNDIVLGRYRLERRIGSGGMADVWLAHDTTTAEEVAVKRLHPHLADDPAMAERFRREALATAAVTHPNVVRVLDASPDAVVLEYIAGETLAERLRSGPLPADLVTRLGAELAGALAAVHAAGLVHRDVSSANVILDADESAHLADFGIARAIDPDDRLTATGDLVGTWRSTAPEVLDGQLPSPASDVWSLGATLAEALTGIPPYPSTSPAALVEARRRPPPRLGSGTLATILVQMLDPDPGVRPSAASVASVLAPTPDATTEVFAMPARAASAKPRAVTGAGGASAPRAWAAGSIGAARRVGYPSRLTRRAAAATAGALLAAGFTLAAAGPAEPSGATGTLPQGPLSQPSSAAPTPTPTPVGANAAAVHPPRHAGHRAGGHGHGGGHRHRWHATHTDGPRGSGPGGRHHHRGGGNDA